MTKLISQTTSGLLLSENFSAPVGWTNSGGFTAEENPSMVTFGQLPIVTLARTPSGIDSQGARESCLLVDGDWRNLSTPRRLMYDSAAAGAVPWRPFMATSTNGGLTYTKLGGWAPALSNGSGGSYASRGSGYIEKRNGVYVIHSLFGAGNFGDSDGEFPTPPYQTDMWTLDSISNWGTLGSYTYIGNSVVVGGSGAFDEKSAYASCTVRDQFGEYLVYYSSTDIGQTNLNVGLSSSTPNASPIGPFTKQVSTGLLSDGSNYGENPKVFWSNNLQRYVMTQDRAHVAGFNDHEMLWVSKQLRDWSSAIGTQIMRVCPADGPLRIGQAGPYYLPEAQPLETPDGFIPISYDNDARDTIDSIGGNLFARVVSAVLEPSRYALDYVPAGTGTITVFSDDFNRSDRTLNGDNGWVLSDGPSGGCTILSNHASLGDSITTKSVYNSGASITNGAIQADLTIQAGGGIGFMSEAKDSANHYFVDFYFDASTPTVLQVSTWKRVSNTETQLETSSVPGVVSAGTQFTAKVVLSSGGQTANYYINGVLQPTTLHFDGSLTGAGFCGMRSGGPGDPVHRYVDNFLVTTTGGADTTVQTFRKTLSNTDFIAEYAVTFNESVGSSFHAFDYRIQGGGDSYRLKLTNGGGLVLQKSSAGVYADLATSSGTLAGITGMAHRIKVSAIGNVHTLWLDGEQQVSYTDSSSPFASGVSIGFAAKTIQQTVRLLSLRTSDTVTVTGLTAGQVVTLRAPGTPPVATLTAAGSSATFTVSHYPAGSIDIDGTDNPVIGNIWGGDSYAAPSGGGGGTTTIIGNRSGGPRPLNLM